MHECMLQFFVSSTTYQFTHLHLAQVIHSFCGIGTLQTWFTAKGFKDFYLILANVCVFLQKYILQIV